MNGVVVKRGVRPIRWLVGAWLDCVYLRGCVYVQAGGVNGGGGVE